MITFTRAPAVAPGDPITSTQISTLAAAFNDRLRSGLADPTWRLAFYWLSLFRQVRNSDETGTLFPALAEFFTVGYQMLEPIDAEWPAAGAGDPEGANLACQIMAYVFGAEAIDLYDEASRLTNPDAGGISLSPADNDADLWNLAKLQRGAYDPATGAIGSPAWAAARAHYKIAMSSRSPHGNAYGSYLPSPELEPEACDNPDTSGDLPPPTNYHIHFTPQREGLPAIDYPGTCQPTTANPYSDHVAWISYSPWAYYVLKNDGSLDILKTADYLEGPYTGEAQLRKTANGALPRMLNAFSGEFRGSDTQRQASSYWLQEAFDVQKFLTTQYHLAPNVGTESGPDVNAVYPLFRFSGSATIPAETLAIHTQTGDDHHAYVDGTVLTACLVSATKLQGACTIELLDDSTVISSVQITADEAGAVSKLVVLSTFPTPNPLKVRLATQAQFADGTGTIDVEVTELMDSKPSHEDLFLVLRCGGAVDSGASDGRGVDEDQARTIGENYFAYGVITNVHGQIEMTPQTDAVNPNAVFDAARRLSQCIRIVPRQNLAGYAVQDGKSICWFTRTAEIGSHIVDLWKGIAPARDGISSGDLIPERRYVVGSGIVTYAGTDYTAGQILTALAGQLTFTATEDASLYEYDGIRHTAEPQGFTNEWLMGVQLKPYHPSDSSLWKPDAYSDFWLFVNRCHFYSPEIANDPPLLWHFAFGNRVSGFFGGVLTPESPSGYNYAPLQHSWSGHNNVNQLDCDEGDDACIEARKQFYRSCRVYEPDPEIESAVMDGDLLKITFKTRFHHADSAPASIDKDPATWDVGALRTEAGTIRTVENALREYLVNQADGTNAIATGAGNNAANSTVQSLPDNPYGSVYPHFLFTQLIPQPREDGNDDQDPTDTPCIHDTFTQMELYLRAMCEGYVDGQTSADYACQFDTTTLFDFTFENLCFQAFGQRWFHTVPPAVRDDNPQGFGPLPNTEMLAAIFNEFSSAINRLTQVRVLLPMKLEVAYDTGSASQSVSGVKNADDADAVCSAGGVCAVYWDGVPVDAPADTVGTWTEGLAPSAFVAATLDGNCDGPGRWIQTTVRQNARIRWQTVDPDATEAIPDSWRDMLEGHGVVLARITYSTMITTRQLTTFDLSQHCCRVSQEPCPGAWSHGDGQYWLFPETGPTTEICSIMPSSLNPQALGFSTLARCQKPDGAVCTPGPINNIGATPIVDDAAMIDVPLV